MKRPILTIAANEAEPVRMVGAANDVVAIAPLTEEVGHSDNWFQISPFGRFPHRVGMQVFDQKAANAIVGLFNSAKDRLARLWRGLPIFVGHPDLDPKAYPDHKKYGSLQALEVRDDGLYGKAKWSAAGKEIVNSEHYDFQSPLWNMEPVPNEAGSFRPVELISVGLTNRPNIPGKPVGANTTADQPDPMKDKLITRFNLKPLEGASEVTDAQIEQALDAERAAANEKPTLAEQLRVANEGKAKAEREKGEEATRAANERKARITERLTTAANTGRITDAEKAGWQTRLETDFDGALTALNALPEKMNVRASNTADLGQRNGGAVAMTRETRIRAANVAVDDYLTAHPKADYNAAFAAVQKDKPELFKDMQQPETAAK